MDPVNVSAKFAVRNFTHSWDNSELYLVLRVGLRTSNLGEEEALEGQGWYSSKERWWVPMGSS